MNKCNYHIEYILNKACFKLGVSRATFSTVHAYIRSLPHHRQQFDYFANLSNPFSIICLIKIWLQESNVDIYNVKGCQVVNEYINI